MPPELGQGEWFITLEVPPGYREEARLDVYITRFILNASRSKVQEGIRQGLVQVNGKEVRRVSHTVQPGDKIVCRMLRPPPTEAKPENIPLDIVYEDEYLIVVNKPAGMVVHPAHGNQTGTMVNALLHHVGAPAVAVEDIDALEDDDVGLSMTNAAPSREGDPSIRPGIVHRLDKDTSGLIVVAKDDLTHRRLAAQFEYRTIRRRYLAIVWGVPKRAAGRIEGAIGRDPRDRKKMAVVAPPAGKHAVTNYELEEALAYTSLVSCRLETGRTHQIRVHMRHIGHPIVGDRVYDGTTLHYGPHSSTRMAFYKHLFEILHRQALHAYTLGFRHPRTGEEMDFKAELPEDMALVLARLREVEGAV